MGESARFDVYVFNTSNTVDLVEVEVTDPSVPNCARSGNHSFKNLNAGETIQYQCQSSDVRVGFTNAITITGKNLLTQEIVQNSSISDQSRA